jgi:hypothetical protein
MPDSGVLVFDSDEVSEFTITVACECYSNHELVGEVLAQLPDFNGNLTWGTPCKPDLAKRVSDADLVLIVSDKAHLPAAIDRWSAYRQAEQASLLIYQQDDEDGLAKQIPGLSLSHSCLVSGFTALTHALFTPVIPQGLVCIDWADTRHLFVMDGQMVVAEASGSQPELAIEAAVTRLRELASGRNILGLQASILYRHKLTMRHVHHLVSACKAMLEEDRLLIVGAPFLDWPEFGQCEVRIAARVACSPGLDTRS